MVSVLENWVVGGAEDKFVARLRIDFTLEITISTHRTIADFDIKERVIARGEVRVFGNVWVGVFGLGLAEGGCADAGVDKTSGFASWEEVEFFTNHHAWVESELFAGADADFVVVGIDGGAGVENAVSDIRIRRDSFGRDDEIGSPGDAPVGGASAVSAAEGVAEGDFTTVDGRAVVNLESFIGVGFLPTGAVRCGAGEVTLALESRYGGVGADFGFGISAIRFVAIRFEFESVADCLAWGESFGEAGNLLAEEARNNLDIVVVAEDAVVTRNFVVSFA